MKGGSCEQAESREAEKRMQGEGNEKEKGS